MRDRTVIISGGGNGIGRAAVLLCAERGARVAVLDVAGERALAVAEEARRQGAPAALGIACDVSDEREVEAAFAAAYAALGAPHGLFCAAGIDESCMVHELEYTAWDRQLAINLGGTFLCCKHAIRAFLNADDGGSIVCTSSPAAFRALPGGTAAYSASKAGISALVRCMAIDYAAQRIRVNAVVPGATETALMWSTTPAEEIPRMRAVVEAEVPLGRLATPEEPARAAVWLLSDDASYITGTQLVCDGGIMARAPISV